MRVANAHIVITGGSRGIGASLAREVVRRGARVTLLARREGPLKELATELDAHAVPIDLTSADELDGLIGQIEDIAGPIDALVNNAAVAVSGEFVNSSAAEIRNHLLTNLAAPMELCRQIAPRMIARGHGNLMAISSISAEFALRNVASYGASKAGLNQFQVNLRRELKRTPIHVGLAILGGVETDMLVDGRRDPVIAAVDRRFRMLGALHPDNVATTLADALEQDRRTVVMPRVIAPSYHLRQVPSRLADALTWRID